MEAARFLQTGIKAARKLKNVTSNAAIATPWAKVVSFPHRKQSPSKISIDPKTGNWALAIGTWFCDDAGSGQEAYLLDRYLSVGPERLAKALEGFFVILIGDARLQVTYCITDIIGSCHCFVRSLGNVLSLSTSSLLLAGLHQAKLDPTASQEFLRTGVIYEDRTLFQDIRKLQPASVYRVEGNQLYSVCSYWSLRDLDFESLGAKQAVGMLAENLTVVAKKISARFPSPICDLTGGYDSRAVVAAFVTSGVNFSTTVSGAHDSPDAVVSAGLAKMLRLRHQCIARATNLSFATLVQAIQLTDGEYDPFEYSGTMKVHENLSEGNDISINGSFGELARGYWWELLQPRIGAPNAFDARRVAARRFAPLSTDASLFPPDLRIDLIDHFTQIIKRANTGLESHPNTAMMDNVYLALRMQRWQGRIASSTNQIWPCLSLFLFRSVLETILKTHHKIRHRSLLIRMLLNQIQPEMASFPLEHGYPAAPFSALNSYKFLPLVLHYAEKAFFKAQKLSRMTPSKAPGRPPQPAIDSASQNEISHMLSSNMNRLGQVLDINALKATLDRPRMVPASGSFWSRLFSLSFVTAALSEHHNSVASAGL